MFLWHFVHYLKSQMCRPIGLCIEMHSIIIQTRIFLSKCCRFQKVYHYKILDGIPVPERVKIAKTSNDYL